MTAPAVHVRELGKTYKVYSSPWDRISEALVRRPRHREFVALAGIDFDLPRGEGLGVIGENGAGKSTLLKILAGIVTPSSGTANVRGQVGSILELGSGFHPEFTGRQNIRLSAAMLGLGPEEVEERTPWIIEFSELGDFIDRPVKTYSTGMAMRLGFSIATQIQPDVLIIDEALSVGDGYFQKKCMDHLLHFLGDGGTLLFCSHAMYYVSAFCSRALWLRNGQPATLGRADDVVREYQYFLVAKSRSREDDEESVASAETAGRAGPARIVAIELVGGEESEEGVRSFRYGESLRIDVEWMSERPEPAFHLGVGIDRADGVEVLGFATHLDGIEPYSGALHHRVSLEIPEQPLNKGEFTIHVFLLDEEGLHPYDQKTLARSVRIHHPTFTVGLTRAEHRWKRSGPESDELSGRLAARKASG